MAKVLLLNPPGKELYLRDQHCSSASKADYYWPPIDLILLSGILSQQHEAYVIDAVIEGMTEEGCTKKILGLMPHFIVFITGSVSWVADFEYMSKVKAACGAKLIASGGFLRSDYRMVMERFGFLDAVLFDFTSNYLLNFIKGNYDGLRDMCIRNNNEIEVFQENRVKQFVIPVPRHELFPLDKYRLPHARLMPFTSVLTNYGCPYSCSYCIAEHVNFKYRPVDNVLPEIEKIVSLGVKEIFFKDFTFGVPRKVAWDLCEALINKYPGLSWICSSRVDVMDEELLAQMKKAGCHTIQFGVESASQQLLDENNKQINIESIVKTFAACRKLGIKTLAHFILGLPGETEQSVFETIKLAKMIKCDYASFNVVTPVYGTSLRKRCIENNWLVGENEEFDSSNGYPVIETPYLSREKLWDLRNKAVKEYYFRPGFMLRKLLDVRSFKSLLNLIQNGFSLLGTIRKMPGVKEKL
jgi:anaerobic magnesium-protoporphyrin IX monomethyl ester cyclase